MTLPSPQPESSAAQALETAIESHPFLVGLKPDHLRALKDNALMMRYEPGEVIFREGEPANRFYLIASSARTTAIWATNCSSA